jgi:acyl-[acyl-carrier-protein]-phospholipid O-acyltransferase/long-chain-fatty-acid--[acyl-carrier-protein] ligase
MLSKKLELLDCKNIGILVPPSAGCMISIIACMMAGKTPVLLNYSTGAEKNCLYAQEKCNFRTIITSKKLLAKLKIKPIKGMIYLEKIMSRMTKLDKIRAFAIAKLPAAMIKKSVKRCPVDRPAVILFTSGSEKDPKAVMLSHKNIGSNVKSIPYTLPVVPEDNYMANLPYFHVFGLTTMFFLPLSKGSTIVSHANPLDYRTICQSLKKYNITVMVGTPTFYHGYLRKSNPGDFDTIRIAISGADKLSKQVRQEYLDKHNLEIMEGYGATETSPVISTNGPGTNKPGTVGRPLKGVKVKIMDRETDKELGPDKQGKIFVKGDLVMMGYYNDIEETSLRMHNGWYDTGDMGLIDKDGFIHHKGRLKRFVKIGGEMVSLVNVESVLEQFLPAETTFCVVDVPNPIKGADIVAAVTTKEINKKQLLKKMGKELPNIALPKEFHVIDSLPMMPSGKVNFREVEKMFRDMHEQKNKKKRESKIAKYGLEE